MTGLPRQLGLSLVGLMSVSFQEHTATWTCRVSGKSKVLKRFSRCLVDGSQNFERCLGALLRQVSPICSNPSDFGPAVHRRKPRGQLFALYVTFFEKTFRQYLPSQVPNTSYSTWQTHLLALPMTS
ncbi:hypothetical protein F5B19DRAFT_442024 [Rostrohypoxylon terebratum]|nr:hypothetical protein F5B19DRAFT_442024 [Rostrohypoxylon terebratum]